MATRKSVRTVLAAVAEAGASGQVAARKAVGLAWPFGADVVPNLATSIGGRELDARALVERPRAIPEAVARAASRERAGREVAEPRYRSSVGRRGLSRIDWEEERPRPMPPLRATCCWSSRTASGSARGNEFAHGVR